MNMHLLITLVVELANIAILYFELFVPLIVLFNEILKMIITLFSRLYLILISADYYDN